jgi:predicted metal-dependent phosphoesterase TrpH
MNYDYLKNQYLKKEIVPIITDHNVFAGATEMSKRLQCIRGMEIITEDGEIIGAFLKTHVPPGLSLDKTLDVIHAQGGIAIVPHPFDRLRRKRIRLESQPPSIIKKIDAIEVFNSRTIFSSDDEKAQLFALKHKLPMVVGSDSHTFLEIGRSYVEMKDFKNAKDFLNNLKNATYVKRKSFFLVHAFTKSLKILRGIS